MRDPFDDIYDALIAGQAANKACYSWQTTADGRDVCVSRERDLEAGLKAFDKARKLKPKERFDYDDSSPPESCSCHTMKMPPCSFCTTNIEDDL